MFDNDHILGEIVLGFGLEIGAPFFGDETRLAMRFQIV
jgi:hypothetical protein